VVTVATDAIDRYHSVMADMAERFGPIDRARAATYLGSIFHGAKLDWIQEGTRLQRRRWFNLKYYTWVEQLGKSVEELDAQQLDAQRDPEWWIQEQEKIQEFDSMLRERRGF